MYSINKLSVKALLYEKSKTKDYALQTSGQHLIIFCVYLVILKIYSLVGQLQWKSSSRPLMHLRRLAIMLYGNWPTVPQSLYRQNSDC